MEDSGRFHGRRLGDHVVAADLLDPGHHLVGIIESIERDAFDHHVGEHAVQAVAHFLAEARHHRVDHDHRGHAQHHADHARQRDIVRLQVSPAEQVFIHVRDSFRGLSVKCAGPPRGSVSRPSALRAHERKQDHVANRRAVHENHAEPVDADPEAAGGGHRVLERADEVVVHLGHRILVAQAGELLAEELFLQAADR